MTIIHPTFNLVARPDVQPDLANFIRASGATRINSRGVIESVAAGTLRHDYDPLTGAYVGWLIEEQRTNLHPHSDLSASVATAGCANTASAVAAPFAGHAMRALTEDGSTGDHLFHGTGMAVAANSNNCFSVFLMANGRSRCRLELSQGGDGCVADVDLAAGTVSGGAAIGTGTYSGAGITAYGNGLYRVWLAGKGAPSATTLYGVVAMKDAGGVLSYGGDGASGLYAYGYQFEAGLMPTSLIVTAGAGATRNAEVLTVPIGRFAFNPQEGTWFADVVESASFGYVICCEDSATDMLLLARISTTNVRYQVQSGGATQAIMDLVCMAQAAGSKYAVTYGTGAYAYGIDGGPVWSSATGIPPASNATLRIGCDPYGTAQLNGHVRHIAYFPRRLSNADLQTITG